MTHDGARHRDTRHCGVTVGICHFIYLADVITVPLMSNRHGCQYSEATNGT